MQTPEPARRPSRLVPIAATAWMAVLVVFLFLAIAAIFYDYFPSDVYIAHRIQDIDPPGFGLFVDFVNVLGVSWLYVPMTAAFAVAFIMRNAWLEGGIVSATYFMRWLDNWIKDAVDRPRPSADLIDVYSTPGDSGFPSGHVVGTATLFLVLFLLMPALVPWRPVRWLAQGLCLLVVLSAGPARIYEGVHWPSDALAGYLLALLFVIPAVVAWRSVTRRGIPQ